MPPSNPCQRSSAEGEGCEKAIVLTSTHDVTDFGDRVARCGARGFVAKAALSGESLAAVLT